MPKVKWIELGDIALGDVVQFRGVWVTVTSLGKTAHREVAVTGESADGDIHTYIDESTAMVRLGTTGDLES